MPRGLSAHLRVMTPPPTPVDALALMKLDYGLYKDSKERKAQAKMGKRCTKVKAGSLELWTRSK